MSQGDSEQPRQQYRKYLEKSYAQRQKKVSFPSTQQRTHILRGIEAQTEVREDRNMPNIEISKPKY